MNTLSLASSRRNRPTLVLSGPSSVNHRFAPAATDHVSDDRIARPRRQVQGVLADAPRPRGLHAELFAQEAGLQAGDQVPVRRLVLEQLAVVQRADDRLQEWAEFGVPGILVEQHQPVDHPGGGEQLLLADRERVVHLQHGADLRVLDPDLRAVQVVLSWNLAPTSAEITQPSSPTLAPNPMLWARP